MRYLSVCSKCGQSREADKLRRDTLRKHGKPDWCSPCYMKHSRDVRNARVAPDRKRSWNITSRYGITKADFEAMLAAQGGACAICSKPMKRVNIDHCHTTGKVRGLLCNYCNRSLPLIENAETHAAAIRYLKGDH